MKFSYRKLSLPRRSDYFGTSILKPIIPVKVIVGGKTVNYSALIDSGADFCIFDAEIGEYLGLDVKNGRREEFGGIQARGGAVAFLHDIVLEIGGFKYKTAIGFSYDIAKRGLGVLGQKGFFEYFKVIFDYVGEEVELREKPI